MSGLLMTRPRPAADSFVAKLPVEFLDAFPVVYSPLLRIDPLSPAVPVEPFSHVIFTSSAAVPHAKRLGIEPRGTAFCVGEATTLAARDMGWAAVMAGRDADALVEFLVARPDAQPVLHLHGVHTIGDVANRLSVRGVPCSGLAVYDQTSLELTPEALELIVSEEPVIAPVFSPRTARQFAKQVPRRAKLICVALSDAVAEPLKGLENSSIRVATRPDGAAMVAALMNAYKSVDRVEGNGTAH